MRFDVLCPNLEKDRWKEGVVCCQKAAVAREEDSTAGVRRKVSLGPWGGKKNHQQGVCSALGRVGSVGPGKREKGETRTLAVDDLNQVWKKKRGLTAHPRSKRTWLCSKRVF